MIRLPLGPDPNLKIPSILRVGWTTAEGIRVKGVRSGLGSFLVSCCGLSSKDPTHVSANQVRTALCCVYCQGSHELGGERISRDLGGTRCSGLRHADFCGGGGLLMRKGDVPGDLVDTERERRNKPLSAASELVGGCAMQHLHSLAGDTLEGCRRRHGRTREQSRHYGNTEQIRNAETGDKGEGQAKYALKADAEGGTCVDG
ncbi:hypothetical protein B0H14DRAFT_2575271 [Mycena olivaceomarginata]|nr:hypothetical protein B0H14DRAFT_2575271 [Mycena olivaceomarginata]